MSEFGIFVTRRGFNASTALNPKYFSFTGSYLTPRIRYGASVAMTLVGTTGTSKSWSKQLILNKDSTSQELILNGYYFISDTTPTRVNISNPYQRTSFVRVQTFNTYIQVDFDLTTGVSVTAVDIEYLVFSNK